MDILQQDWAAKWAMYSPNRLAFKEGHTGRTLSYQDLNRLGNRLAHHLSDHFGLVKGDRLAVLAENCLEYLLLFVAAQKTGLILVPLNYRLAGKEIDYLIRKSEPRLFIGSNQLADLTTTVFSLSEVPCKWSIESLSAFCDSKQKSEKDHFFPLVPLGEDDPIFILFTSGTTGFPKGALYTHKMLFWNSINTAMSLIVNTESRTINCMPPFHTGGWNVLTTPFLHHGGYTCLLPKFDAATVLQLLEKEKATIFMGVPTMLQMIAELPEFGTAKLDHLHYLIVGGAPMPIPMIERWHEKGVPVRQGYGMTEVGPNLTSLHQRDALRKIGSIGRPNFYVDIKINGTEGEAGELLLRGPMVTPGYWKDEAATAKTIKDGWFHSGDMVRQDKEGYLYVVDRIKNMYISGGENVYPAEVERVLNLHPDIREAAVIGVPDPKWGEVGRAFIVFYSGRSLSENAVKEYCLAQLAKFKVPKSIVFLKALPRNEAGKIDKGALKD